MKNVVGIMVTMTLICCNRNYSNPNIQVVNPNVATIIQMYIDSVLRDTDNKTMSIGFATVHDTLEFYLFDSYPDISLGGFFGYAIVDGYRVCFVGDSIYHKYFKVHHNINIPDDIIDANKEKNIILPYIEPKEWSFWSTDSAKINPRRTAAR